MNPSGLTELERGRSEASHTQLKQVNLWQYRAPREDAPFPLEYAFHLLGDISGKTVLDLGCGSGENIKPLLMRGAKVIAVDLSPDLLALAEKRVAMAGQGSDVTFIEASAYEVPLPAASVDAILCASLLHHLEIPKAMAEMRRLLKIGGVVAVKEPVRFSTLYDKLRSLLPAQEDISEDEHPLTRAEFALVKEGWQASGERAFRLPLVPVIKKLFRISDRKVWELDRWLLKRLPLKLFATSRVVKLS